MGTVIARLRQLRREVLGLNRRNQEFLAVLNPPRLVGLVDHKVRTKAVLQQHGLPAPTTFGCYSRQRELGLLAREAERHAEFVLKPARGAGGDGVVVITGRTGGRLVKASGPTLRLSDLIAHAADIMAGAFSLSQARDEAVLEHRLTPEAALGAFSPGGVPDIRVLVVRGVPLMAMLRLPTRGSEGRANLHVGGVGAGIDLHTGQATHAIWRDRSIVLHPDIQRPLAGLQIPAWRDILLLATRSYDAIPLGYCGVDIVVDAQLGPSILELNARPGLGIQLANRQGLRPLLQSLARSAPEQYAARERLDLGLEITAGCA